MRVPRLLLGIGAGVGSQLAYTPLLAPNLDQVEPIFIGLDNLPTDTLVMARFKRGVDAPAKRNAVHIKQFWRAGGNDKHTSRSVFGAGHEHQQLIAEPTPVLTWAKVPVVATGSIILIAELGFDRDTTPRHQIDPGHAVRLA